MYIIIWFIANSIYNWYAQVCFAKSPYNCTIPYVMWNFGLLKTSCLVEIFWEILYLQWPISDHFNVFMVFDGFLTEKWMNIWLFLSIFIVIGNIRFNDSCKAPNDWLFPFCAGKIKVSYQHKHYPQIIINHLQLS